MGRRPKVIPTTTEGSPFDDEGWIVLDAPPIPAGAMTVDAEPIVPIPPPEYRAKKKEEKIEKPAGVSPARVGIPLDVEMLPQDPPKPKKKEPSKKTPKEDIFVYPEEERQLEAKAATSYNGDELLETSLSQEIESENTIKSVSKELFNRTNVALKTEVSHDEINNITRLRFLEQKFGIQNVSVLVNSLLELRVSKERKSRREFIEALQTENRNTNTGGFMSKLFGGGGGGTP